MTEILMARLSDANIVGIITNKGDLLSSSGGSVLVGLAVGANDEVLTADSAEATGLKWAAAGGAQNLFETVAGDSGSAVADTVTDTITMIGGSGITTVGASSPDSVTFNLDATNTVITGLSNLVTVGALDSGSITSGFGAIDVGASSITTTGGIFGNDLTLTNDLLIATGGIINFGAGNLLITHSAASLALTLGNLTVENLASGSAGTPAFRGENMVDDADVLAAIFGGNRATPAAGDVASINLRLSDSAGNQDAFARIKWTAVDETSTTEDGSLTLGVMIAGTITDTATFDLDGLDLVAGDAFSIAGNDVLDATTLGTAVVASSLTSVGTIATGVWEGTAVAIGFGGTGAAAKEAAFDALSPVTTEGDVIFRNATVNTRLARGTTGQVLTATATTIEWAAAGGGDALVANPLSQFAATTSLQLLGVISDETGSGALVFATSPTLVTPALGTPASGVLTNVTGLVSFIVADESTDTTCFPLFVTAATGELGPKSGSNLTFNSNTGVLGATTFSGAGTSLTGTGASFTAGNVTTNANLTGHVTSTGNAAILGAFTVAQLSTALSDASISGNNTGDEVTATVSVSGIGELATAVEYRANTAATPRLLENNLVWSAMAAVALTSTSNLTAWNMSLGIDFVINTLTENTTISNPTVTTDGKKGRLLIIQDAGGTNTVAWGTSYEFAGGTAPTATLTGSAQDVFYYDVISSTRIIISSILDIS